MKAQIPIYRLIFVFISSQTQNAFSVYSANKQLDFSFQYFCSGLYVYTKHIELVHLSPACLRTCYCEERKQSEPRGDIE